MQNLSFRLTVKYGMHWYKHSPVCRKRTRTSAPLCSVTSAHCTCPHLPQTVPMGRESGRKHRRSTFSYSSGGVRLWYTTVGFSPASDIARRKPLRVYLNEGAADSSACAVPPSLSSCVPAWLANYARLACCITQEASRKLSRWLTFFSPLTTFGPALCAPPPLSTAEHFQFHTFFLGCT